MNALPAFFVLDESGTPGLAEEPFVTAGVAFRGDPKALSDEWKRISADEKFPRKGTKFSRSNFLALVDFLLVNSIFPVCSLHTLTADTVQRFRHRCDEFPVHRKPTGLSEYRYPHYIWTQHLFGTIGHALIPLIRHFGPINKLEVRVDQYSLTQEMHAFVCAQFKQMLRQKGGIVNFLETGNSRGWNSMVQEFAREVVKGYQVSDDDLVLKLKAKGPLGQLADAVAALFRQQFLKKEAANDAWIALSLGFENRTVLAMDTTGTMDWLSNSEWAAFN